MNNEIHNEINNEIDYYDEIDIFSTIIYYLFCIDPLQT